MVRQIGNDHPVSSLYTDYCDEVPIRPYDPEKDKYHLKKAGVLGETFEIFATHSLSGTIEGALLFVQSAEPAGVKIKVIRTPSEMCGQGKAPRRT